MKVETLHNERADFVVDGRKTDVKTTARSRSAGLASPAPWSTRIDGVQYAKVELASEDKVTLAYYMATMMKRVPRHRQRLATMIPGVMDGTFNELYSQLAVAREANPEYVQNIDHHIGRAQELQEQYKKALPPELMVRLREPWPSPNVAATLAAMTWRLGISEGPSFFLTNDNPLFFFECWGVGRAESEIAFTLSTTMVLHANLQQGRDLAYFPMPQALVKEINRRYAMSATRYLFYNRGEDWVKALSQKDRDTRELNRILWSD